MDDALLLRTAGRHLRRKYATDLPGLTAFADSLASQSKDSPVTVTSASLEGGATSGQVTMQREIWLAAAEDLLANPRFNPAAAGQSARVIIPDWRFSTPV